MNDVKASQHDAATVFVAADNHKEGDYSPYLYASADHGRTWRSIAGDLPDGVIIWSVEQDHVNPDLLFVGAENGIHFTPNGGANWIMLGAGAPTISFRDLEIQRRDDDLVGATFGRGFYILDDYAPLREMADGEPAAGAVLFSVRDAWWYIPNAPLQAPGQPTLGTTSFVAPNPDFGATFTYWLADPPETARQERRRAEAGGGRAGRGHRLPRLRRPAGRGAGERAARGAAGARRRRPGRAARHGPRDRGAAPRRVGPASPPLPTPST